MDPIDELVQASLDRKIKRGAAIEKCDYCTDSWHGLSRPSCPGAYGRGVDSEVLD